MEFEARMGIIMPAIALIYLFLIAVFIVIILIYLRGRFADNAYVKAIAEWQTLIGAIIGFMAVSLAILLQGDLVDRKESQRKEENEIAIITNTISDLERVVRSINVLQKIYQKNWRKYLSMSVL